MITDQIEDQIEQEMRSARPDSQDDGARDIHGVLEKIAYFRHLGDLRVNQIETLTRNQNWIFAKSIFYRWTLDHYQATPFDTLAGFAHDYLNELAYCESESLHLGDDGNTQDDHWNKARERLASRVLDYHFHPGLIP